MLLRADVEKGFVMFYDAMILLMIAVIAPLGGIVAFCGLAKKKRHRRPLPNFR